MKKMFYFAATLSVAGLLTALAPSAMADAAAGKAIYDGKGACGSCHGLTGRGDGPAAAALDPKPRSFTEGVF
ncbi:MAG: c-type cytochrome, partial [Pseudomonadota bacterium]